MTGPRIHDVREDATVTIEMKSCIEACGRCSETCLQTAMHCERVGGMDACVKACRVCAKECRVSFIIEDYAENEYIESSSAVAE